MPVYVLSYSGICSFNNNSIFVNYSVGRHFMKITLWAGVGDFMPPYLMCHFISFGNSKQTELFKDTKNRMVVPKLKVVLWQFEFPPEEDRGDWHFWNSFEMSITCAVVPPPPSEIPLNHMTPTLSVCLQGETMTSNVSVVMEACDAGNLGMIHG